MPFHKVMGFSGSGANLASAWQTVLLKDATSSNIKAANTEANEYSNRFSSNSLNQLNQDTFQINIPFGKRHNRDQERPQESKRGRSEGWFRDSQKNRKIGFLKHLRLARGEFAEA